MNTIKKEIVLIRGLPGSGKTTIAKKMTEHTHVEADMFFERTGEYVYVASEVRNSHAWCLEKAKEAVAKGNNIVISNTFMKKWEMKPYQDLAQEHNYSVRILVADGSYPNTHGVTAEKMEIFRTCWQA